MKHICILCMPYEIHICILCMPYEMCFGGWHAWISLSDLYVLVLPLLVKQIKILNRFRVTVSVHCPSGASVWSSNILSSSKKADKYVHLLGSQREAQLSLFFSLFFFFKETPFKGFVIQSITGFLPCNASSQGPRGQSSCCVAYNSNKFYTWTEGYLEAFRERGAILADKVGQKASNWTSHKITTLSKMTFTCYPIPITPTLRKRQSSARHL